MNNINNYLYKLAANAQAKQVNAAPEKVDMDRVPVKGTNKLNPTDIATNYRNSDYQPGYSAADRHTVRYEQGNRAPLPDTFTVDNPENPVQWGDSPFPRLDKKTQLSDSYAGNHTGKNVSPTYNPNPAAGNFKNVPAERTVTYNADQPSSYPWAKMQGGDPVWSKVQTDKTDGGFMQDTYMANTVSPKEYNGMVAESLPREWKYAPGGLKETFMDLIGKPNEQIISPSQNQARQYDPAALLTATRPNIGSAKDAKNFIAQKQNARNHPDSQLAPIPSSISVDDNMDTNGALYRGSGNNLSGSGDLILLPKDKKAPNHNERATELVNSSLNAPAVMKQPTTELDYAGRPVPGISYGNNMAPNDEMSPGTFANSLSAIRELGANMGMDMDNGTDEQIRGNYQKATDAYLQGGELPNERIKYNRQNTNVPEGTTSDQYLKNVNTQTLRGVVKNKDQKANMDKMASLCLAATLGV